MVRNSEGLIFVLQVLLFKSCEVSCSSRLAALKTFQMTEQANLFHSLSRFDHHIYIYCLQQAPEKIKHR